MKYLIDTHILIWIFSDNTRISPAIKEILNDKNCEICTLSLSFWEIAIKINCGKFQFENFDIISFPELVKKAGIKIVDVSAKDYVRYTTLPNEHKDPFDRMLIQYAISNNITLLSQDSRFKDYTKHGLSLIC